MEIPTALRPVSTLAMTAILTIMSACVRPPVLPPSEAQDASPADRSVLAGEWQYEDGAVTTLRLDDQGNGTYKWKDGRFETTRLADHTWVGKWSQKDNDREGGFIVKLSGDYQEGEGTWWYVRIGSDRTPTQRGGSFHLTKKTSLTNLGETPAVP